MGIKDEENVVSVSPEGEITILKEFREKLDMETSGRVTFVKKGDEEFVIRPVEGATEGDDQEDAISITSDGEITIPEEYREALDIETPGRAILAQEDSELILRPVHESLGY